mmetsp:Transcript_13205/g.17993  ORF Transcript_13205/g.17993 Transcript_13205/m.17993 type:complete len:191 (-) Transcript_13205:492-1064(-)
MVIPVGIPEVAFNTESPAGGAVFIAARSTAPTENPFWAEDATPTSNSTPPSVVVTPESVPDIEAVVSSEVVPRVLDLVAFALVPCVANNGSGVRIAGVEKTGTLFVPEDEVATEGVVDEDKEVVKEEEENSEGGKFVVAKGVVLRITPALEIEGFALLCAPGEIEFTGEVVASFRGIELVFSEVPRVPRT